MGHRLSTDFKELAFPDYCTNKKEWKRAKFFFPTLFNLHSKPLTVIAKLAHPSLTCQIN